MEPVIGAPTLSPVLSRYLMAKITTRTETSSAKNPVTARMKKYRLSTSGANEDACSGKSGIPDNIGITASRAARSLRPRLPAPSEHDETPDEQNGQHPAQTHEVHHHDPVSPALRVIVEAVQQQLVDGRADFSLTRFHERQPQLLRRVLDTVKVPGQL